MPHSAPVRLAVLTAAALASLTLGALVAPAAHADENPTPPGLSSLPSESGANLKAVPLSDSFGRKLR